MRYKLRTTPKLEQSLVFVALAVILFLTVPILGIDSAGGLDPTFGTDGKVRTVMPGNNHPEQMALQPDRKIVLRGHSYSDDYSDESDFLARYNSDGSLDRSFGINGIVVIQNLTPSDVTLQDGPVISLNGKIMVCGSQYDVATNRTIYVLLRFDDDGTLDPSFGTNGSAVMSFGADNNRYDSAQQILVQPDGRIVVAGITESQCYESPFDGYVCQVDGIGVVRFRSDGVVDSSFGINGKTIVPPSGFRLNYVSDLAIAPDGKLLLIGLQNFRVFLESLNADGTLDPSFGTGGILLPEVDDRQVDVHEVAIQPDGKIDFPVANNRHSPTFTTIVRLDPNGTPDTTFGTDGKVVIPATEGVLYGPILVELDGKIAVGGCAVPNSAPPLYFALTQLNADGSRDATFGSNGTTTSLLASYGGCVSDIAQQPDGKLIAVGGVQDNNSDVDIGLARYLNHNASKAAKTDLDFDGDGSSDVAVFRSSEATWFLSQSTSGYSATTFGLVSDVMTPADFDGDGKTDIAVYRNGNWYWLSSLNGSFSSYHFGTALDVPVPADFSGDGREELAIYRNGIWWMHDLASGQDSAFQFGANTDIPMAADFDGDGRADQAVNREGIWYINRSTAGFAAIQFGYGYDKLVPADYDGDGKTDVAVYRTGTWYVLGTQVGFYAFQFGTPTDIPVPADYDGDGKADLAVFRPADGNWYLQKSISGFSAIHFGENGDRPVRGPVYDPTCHGCWDY